MSKTKLTAYSSISGLMMDGDLELSNCRIREVTQEDVIIHELVKWNLSNIHYLYADDFDKDLIIKHLGVNYLVTYECLDTVNEHDDISKIPELNCCNKILYMLITCFRLFKKGLIGTNYVNYVYLKSVDDNNSRIGRRIYLDTKRYNPIIDQLGGYFLSEIEKNEFRLFYDDYSNKLGKCSGSIKRSIEWFNKTYNEINLENILLSLIISLETLYQESSLRLILRCTYNIGENKDEREIIYHELDEAIKLRNKIVHGGSIETEECKTLIKNIDTYVRSSIIKFLDYNNSKHLINFLDNTIIRGT